MIDSLIGLFAVISLISPAHAAPSIRPLPVAPDAPRAMPPKRRRPESFGIDATSQSVFVADIATGSVLYAKKPHVVRSIASLTKLMTAMVFLDTKPNLDEPVTFQEEDFDAESKAVFLVGETMTKREALQALLVGSVNAAGNALARTSLGRDAFVQKMNDKAKELKLTSPVFVEPTGIDPRNRANAADVAAMLSIAMTYPDIRATAALGQVTIHGKSGKEYLLKSTNLLIDSFLNHAPYHIVGAKTGSLPQAGYCMAQITGDQAGHQIVVVGLGSDNHFSRYQDIKAVTAWAFDTFEWQQ